MKQESQNLIGDDLISEVSPFIISFIILILARMIRAKEIDPSKIKSKKRLFSIVDKIGRTEEYGDEKGDRLLFEMIMKVHQGN